MHSLYVQSCTEFLATSKITVAMHTFAGADLGRGGGGGWIAFWVSSCNFAIHQDGISLGFFSPDHMQDLHILQHSQHSLFYSKHGFFNHIIGLENLCILNLISASLIPFLHRPSLTTSSHPHSKIIIWICHYLWCLN